MFDRLYERGMHATAPHSIELLNDVDMDHSLGCLAGDDGDDW
jgi:hypothetical protein